MKGGVGWVAFCFLDVILSVDEIDGWSEESYAAAIAGYGCLVVSYVCFSM